MTDWRDIVEFNRDCNKWEEILKGHCCTTEEQKVISDCFIRMKDRFETTRLRMAEFERPELKSVEFPLDFFRG